MHIVDKHSNIWPSGNLPGHCGENTCICYALRGGGGLRRMEKSLIVGLGLRVCVLSHDLCGEECVSSHLGSQRTSDLEGVCDMLIIGGNALRRQGRGDNPHRSVCLSLFLPIRGNPRRHDIPRCVAQSHAAARGGVLHVYLHAAFTVSPQNCRQDALRGGFSLRCNSSR
jgi:hypothetical protein